MVVGRGSWDVSEGRHSDCDVHGMGVKRVDELRVWQQAKELANAVSALVSQEPLRRDFAFRDQLNRASVSAEGFAQGTDRGFARYLVVARGSTAEVRSLLILASEQRRIGRDEFASLEAICDSISRMLTTLIRYLVRENRNVRH